MEPRQMCDLSYTWIHAWIRNNKPKPNFCECCNINKPHDVACIGIYIKDINQFKWLCRKCHMEQDGRLKVWLERNKNRKKYPIIPEGYCACGCGLKIKLIDKRCRKIKFKKGHNNYVLHNNPQGYNQYKKRCIN